MVRNIVLAVSSLAVLGLLFAAYWLLLGTPASAPVERPVTETLQTPQVPTTQPLKIGDAIEVPAGGKIIFRRFDEKTGRPRDMFACQDWQPVPDARNEIRVTAPELAMLLPSGMIATITADAGQITVDRVEQSQMRPKNGHLAGHVRIVVDRDTAPERTPAAARPEDLITISVDRLEFDLELGELQTNERLTVASEDFEIAGSGLHLIWNQADNRIETLSIAHGEEFVLYPAAGLFGMVTNDEQAGPPPTPPLQAGEPPRRRPRPRRATAYQCILDGGLVAEQFRGAERVGGLEADEVKLLFDVGGGADKFLRSRPTSAPATRPAREERERLVLRWNGRLQLTPTAAAPAGEPNRRRFEARGHPVVLSRGDGHVRCGQVAFHDDTQRVWLYPMEGGTVEFGLGAKLAAAAQSIYIDRLARIVKLIGNVELRSQRGTGTTARLSAIRCAYWGELHIAAGAATTQPTATDDALLTAERLESAVFVGDVQVDLGAQQLTGHRLDVGFRADAGGQTLEELLDTAQASGNVRLTSGNGRLECGDLRLVFDLTPAHELYPYQMDATGAVLISRGATSIRGHRVTADLAPPPEQPGAKAVFVIRALRVLGAAELIDPDNRVAARGHEIAAAFAGVNELTTATVRGGEGEFGVVHARPYTVRGELISLDRAAQTVHVDGLARLSFKTQRSLQGESRSQPTPIVVHSRRLLHIDGLRNTVRFEGDVRADSGDEQLQGDTLTLLLEDITAPPAPAPTTLSLRDVWRTARRLLGGQGDLPSKDDLFALRVSGPTERFRKEPVRLTADHALVASESYAPGEDLPVVHTSISAPLLEVDIINRQITTTGETELLMTDRRGLNDVEPARDALGVPSALLSRGASQTAMGCLGRMTYTLGVDGPDRRDTVVFEDRVVFVHRTGKEMVDVEQMLPRGTDRTVAVENLKSRNATLDCDRLECWFSVDSAAPRAARGGVLTRAPLRLASLIASGGVYLRDQEEARVREVNAAWIEFNRELGRIHVRGAPQADARVYFENLQSGQFDVHAGPELVINLNDGTIRTDTLTGEIRR